MKNISRRDFIKYAGTGAAGLIASRAFAGSSESIRATDDPSTVVECFDDAATNGASIIEPVVQIMTDESIKALTGINEVGPAWKSLFPGIVETSTISIKVNCASRYCPTTPEAVNCIIDGLARMDVGSGFKKNNVVVWERTDVELTRAGFTIYDGADPDTPRCFGTDHAGIGYDYGTSLVCNGHTVNPSKIISQMSDYMINAACLKDHSIARVTLCLKNHYGSVYDVAPMHTANCNPWIPALNQQARDVLVPPDKQKLFFVDGLFGIYSGGPGGQPNCNPKKLLMSKDPVAVDFRGQKLFNDFRVANGRTPVDAEHIRTAAEPPYNLGTTEVNLVEIYNPTGISGRKPIPAKTGLKVSPNPIRNRALVAFSTSGDAPARLDLVDRSGRVVHRVHQGPFAAGHHRVELRVPRTVGAGTYLLKLTGPEPVSTKVTILR